MGNGCLATTLDHVGERDCTVFGTGDQGYLTQAWQWVWSYPVQETNLASDGKVWLGLPN